MTNDQIIPFKIISREKKIKRITFTIRLDDTLLIKIKEIQNKYNTNRSEAIRIMLGDFNEFK